MKPFYFYGGYVALSAEDRFEYKESEKIAHYQRLIFDLQDANENLKNEVGAMTKWNEAHTKRIENQSTEVHRMEIKIENQKKELKRFKADAEARLKAISLSYYNKFRSLTDTRDQEKEVIESEIEITKKIRELASIKEK